MAVTSDDATQKKTTTRTRKPKMVSTVESKEVVVDNPEKVLVRMERACLSWVTHEGVTFTTEHPYQLVSDGESELLMREGGFRKAHPDELKQWYSNE